MNEFSVVIPYYGDRIGWVRRNLENTKDDQRVIEVVCIDDHSEYHHFNALKCLMCEYKKLRVVRNRENLFLFRNKIKAVTEASCEWVALIDSDNVIDGSYFDALPTGLNPKTIYQPSKLKAFDFSPLSGRSFSMLNAKFYVDDKCFSMMINACNYVLHKKTWLKSVAGGRRVEDCGGVKSAADVININFRCLVSGMKIYVVPGMEYEHNVHDGSNYLKHAKQSAIDSDFIKKVLVRYDEIFGPPV